MDDDEDCAMALVVASRRAREEGLTREQFIHAAGVFWDATEGLRLFLGKGIRGETGATENEEGAK